MKGKYYTFIISIILILIHFLHTWKWVRLKRTKVIEPQKPQALVLFFKAGWHSLYNEDMWSTYNM